MNHKDLSRLDGITRDLLRIRRELDQIADNTRDDEVRAAAGEVKSAYQNCLSALVRHTLKMEAEA